MEALLAKLQQNLNQGNVGQAVGEDLLSGKKSSRDLLLKLAELKYIEIQTKQTPGELSDQAKLPGVGLDAAVWSHTIGGPVAGIMDRDMGLPQ